MDSHPDPPMGEEVVLLHRLEQVSRRTGIPLDELVLHLAELEAAGLIAPQGLLQVTPQGLAFLQARRSGRAMMGRLEAASAASADTPA